MRRIVYITLFLLAATVAKAQIEQAQRTVELNELQQLGWRIQACSLSFDKNAIVFSGRQPDGNSYDLYIARKVNGKWDTPTPLRTVNTSNDEFWPSMSSDETQIYFTRRIPADPHDRKSEEQFVLYVTTCTDGVWDTGKSLVISNGTDIAPLIMRDNQTLFFASKRPIPDRKDRTYALYFTRRTGKYSWTVPELIAAAPEKGAHYYGCVLTGAAKAPVLTFTKQYCTRRDTIYTTETLTLYEKYRSQPVLTLSGTVKDVETDNYLPNTMTVRLAQTMQTITTLSNDGRFQVALPIGQEYLIDITAPNYSHTYLTYDCRKLTKDSTVTLPLTLFHQLAVRVNIFDETTHQPLSDVHCHPAGVGKARDNGFDLLLPLGQTHTLQFAKKGYQLRDVVIDTHVEALLPSTTIDVTLMPAEAPLYISLFNATTKESVHGTIRLTNQQSGEELPYSVSMQLLQGETFAVNASVQGFFRLDTLITIPQSENAQVHQFGLVPIKPDTTWRLQHVQFENTSAALREAANQELDEIVQLLQDNPTLTATFTVFTDEKGKDAYNDKLSQARAETVKAYMLRQGIDVSRVTAIGRGKRQPLVTGDGEDKRAINRRVELKLSENK